MATMKDVAELAGVSTATVSHVLNGTKKISEETTQKVLQAITESGYAPNAVARSLRSGYSRTIGVLVEDSRGLPVPEIVNGLAEALSANGYQMILSDLHLLEELYNRYEQIGAYREHINNGVNLLLSANVDGIIYVGMHDRHLTDLFDPVEKPIVFAFSHGNSQDSFVTYANRDSAKSLMQLLIDNGHTRIAVIAGHPHSYPTIQRLKGVQIALSEAGITLPEEYIQYGNWEYESGIQATQKLLSLREKPSAVFAMNDLMAAGCIHALSDAGFRVPLDVSVAGFDNREISRYLQPPITTVAIPLKEIGVRSAEIILAKLRNPDTPVQSIVLPCQIISRDSVRRAD